MEKAGPKYLFKIGKIIGSQVDLYNEKDRKLPVDLEFPESHNTTITVTIPKGYKILNPEALRKISDYVGRDGKTVMSFSSSYKITGNKLTVTINEYYKQTHIPVAEFDWYKKVMNTAADFNKVVLVLAKK